MARGTGICIRLPHNACVVCWSSRTGHTSHTADPDLSVRTSTQSRLLVSITLRLTTIRSMQETPASLENPIARSVTVASRFNEHFSESSGDALPRHMTTGTLHIIQGLETERNRQRKRSNRFGRKLSRQRSKRLNNATTMAYEHRRSMTRSIINNHREARRLQQKHEEEHKRRSRMSGMMWGFDPTAGRLSSSTQVDDRARGCFVFKGRGEDDAEYGAEELDTLSRRTGRRWLQGSKWGIECGGRGKQPVFENCEVDDGQRLPEMWE